MKASAIPLIVLGLGAAYLVTRAGAQAAAVGGVTGWDVYSKYTETQLRAVLGGANMVPIMLTKNGAMVPVFMTSVDAAGNFAGRTDAGGTAFQGALLEAVGLAPAAPITFRAENVADVNGNVPS